MESAMSDDTTEPCSDDGPEDEVTIEEAEKLAQELEAEVAAAEEENPSPPPPPRQQFQCRKLHKWYGGGARTVAHDRMTGAVVADTGPTCPICQYDWFTRKFGGRPTGKTEPQPAKVEPS
jgi:hypothetical protein